MNQSITSIRRELNFRDLGGYKTEDGRTVRHGMLYRSARLFGCDEADLKIIRSLGIVRILDFRERYSWIKKPDPDIGATYVQCQERTSIGAQGIDFTAKGFGQVGEGARQQLSKLQEYYASMPYGYDAFHKIIDELKAGNAPFLIHCSKGKDRTGISVMMVLLLLGCDEATVLKDYLLSNEYRRSLIEKRLAEGRSQHPEDEDFMRLTFLREGVEEKIGRAAIDRIKERSGTIENYFREEYGLTDADVEQIRSTYLE